MAADDFDRLRVNVHLRQYAVRQIRSIEGTDEYRRFAQTQLPHDVIANSRRRRRREGVQTGLRELLAQ